MVDGWNINGPPLFWLVLITVRWGCVYLPFTGAAAGKDQIVGDGLELQSENKFMRILDRTIPQELLLLCLVFLIRLINSRWCSVQCYVQEEFI